MIDLICYSHSITHLISQVVAYRQMFLSTTLLIVVVLRAMGVVLNIFHSSKKVYR
jgi:hypothetical protein